LLKANGINIMNALLCFWIRFNIGGFRLLILTQWGLFPCINQRRIN
jgi:hypothetical protein